ncbi:terpene synthase family protein [Streptomyces sp. NPDC051662]|uniref:terpene synthase family protein n=1 Tax=Streptomyces sp. NPDC051662 TaxID=3154750 RepID=UPI0034331842
MWKQRVTVTLPSYEIPVPVRPAPFEQMVIRSEEPWAKRMGIDDSTIDSYRALNSGRLASLEYPTSPLEECEQANNWTWWYFYYDDQFSGPLGLDLPGTRRTIETTLKVFRGHRPDPSDLRNWALYHLCEELFAAMPTAWNNRFVEHNDAWLRGYLWETALRIEDRVPGLAEFTSNRLWTSGMKMTMDLVEYAARVAPPEWFMRHKVIDQLTTDLSNMTGWSNEVISLDMEARFHPVNNLVYVLYRHETHNMQEAVDRTHTMYRNVSRDALAARRQLPAVMDELHLTRSEQGAAWRRLEAAYTCLGGGLAWQLETGRYKHTTGTVDLPVPELT